MKLNYGSFLAFQLTISPDNLIYSEYYYNFFLNKFSLRGIKQFFLNNFLGGYDGKC
jgi:hypothetical protein